MFGRQIDVVFVKNDGTALVLVDHNNHPNTYICEGTFTYYESPTVTDSCTLSIYNLSSATRGLIALGGYGTVIIRYGYKDENTLGEIFVGNIQRIIHTNQDAVTNTTKFYLLDTGDFKNYAFFSGSYADGVNYYQIAQDIAKSDSSVSLQLSEKLKQFAVSGGQTYFGSADSALQQMAEDTGFVYTRSRNILSITTPEEIVNQSDVFVFSQYNIQSGKIESNSGMIGFPELTDDGLYINCLVNSKIQIHSLIKIDNSIVSIEQEGAVPSTQYGATLDPDGLYVVVNITGNFSNNGSQNRMRIKTYSRTVFLNMTAVTDEED